MYWNAPVKKTNIMKRLLILFIISYISVGIKAQLNIDTDVFIDYCMKEVDKIDKQILYKTQIDYSGYRLGPNNSVNELLTVLYFDTNNAIRKSMLIYSIEISGIGYYNLHNLLLG